MLQMSYEFGTMCTSISANQANSGCSVGPPHGRRLPSRRHWACADTIIHARNLDYSMPVRNLTAKISFMHRGRCVVAVAVLTRKKNSSAVSRQALPFPMQCCVLRHNLCRLHGTADRDAAWRMVRVAGHSQSECVSLHRKPAPVAAVT